LSEHKDLVFSLDARLQGTIFTPAPKAIVIENLQAKRRTFRCLLKRWLETEISDGIVAKDHGFDTERV
jgi:hypothetical protein